jgi:hypothetical protein
VRFDDSGLSFSYQYLDPVLLSTRLLESLVYLHCQPPLFNLFLGSVLKLSPENPTTLFHIVFVCCGLALYLTVVSLQIRLGVSRTVAVVLGSLFLMSPSFILYEKMLFYTFPMAACLVLSALCLSVTLTKQAKWAAWCFFLLLVVLAGVRTVFHISHYILVLVGLAILLRKEVRRMMWPALVSLLLIVAMYGKNYVLFDKFTVSTWMGMNFWLVTGARLPLEERESLVAQGKLSEVALVPQFSGLDRYPGEYVEVKGYEGIPALRQKKRSTGSNNYNHLAYIGIADQYLRDSEYVFRHYPRSVAVSILKNYFDFFKSSTEHGYLRPNLDRVPTVVNIYDRVFYGKVGIDPRRYFGSVASEDTPSESFVYLGLLIGLPIVVVYALRYAVMGGDGADGTGQSARILVLYLCCNIIFVALTVNVVTFKEVNRYRFMTDPCSLVLLGLFVERFVKGTLLRRH